MDQEQDLSFTIKILHANFTTSGRYFLTLQITGTKINRSKIKLYVNNSREPLHGHEFTTDACLEDGDPETMATFTDSLVTFWMPSESAKGDIQLLIEAFHLPENPMHEGEKCGEAVFDVFPRRGALFSGVRHDTPPAQDPNELYQFETQFMLSQALDGEGFSANSGAVTAAVALKYEDPEPEKVQSLESKVELREKHERKDQERGVRNKEMIPVCRDSLVIKQLQAGSLANFCPNCDSDFVELESSIVPEVVLSNLREKSKRKESNRIYKKEEMIPVWKRSNERISSSHSEEDDFHSRTQEQAGSLANFCTSYELTSSESGRELCSSDEVSQSSKEGRYMGVVGEPLGPDRNSEAVLVREHVVDKNLGRRRTVPVNFGLHKKLENTVKGHGAAEIRSLSTIERKSQEIRARKTEDKTVAAYQRREHTRYMLEPEKKPQLLPVPGDPGAGPSSGGVRRIQEAPLEPLASGVPVRHMCGSYTARKGYCEVVVLAHGALGLPFKSDGRPPQPYIAGKSGRDLNQLRDNQSVTHAAIQPTHSPSWEELLLIEVQEEESKDEVIVLQVADHPSKELLTEYSVPLSHLKPFHQYHLELVQPNPELSGDIRLYITIIKKMDKLPLPAAGSKIYGMEVLLRGLDTSVTSQMGPLVATGRVVADWTQYRGTMLSAQPRPAGVSVTTIHFPSPHPTSFAVAGVTHLYGAPLVTVAGEPQEQPQWNHTLFFAGDESSMFTCTSALVVEYYPASLAMSEDWWQLRSPIGYSYQTLDQLLLSSLQWDSGRLGLRVDNLPIEGSQLRTAIGSGPTVSMVLRLVTNERPDQLLSAAHLSSLPAFRTGPQVSHLGQPAPTQQLQQTQQTPYGLPPMDAVKNVLPQFHSLYNTPRAEPVRDYVPMANISSPTDRGNLDPSGTLGEGAHQIPPEIRGTLDIRSLAVLDYQMKEVDRYRTAMRKMATDLLHVREDSKRLEEANSRLRRELGQHDEISRLMVSSKDLDNVTHSELVQKFVLLKKKLADESTKKQELQARLQRLQNDLIKKNDMAKEYLMLQEAHEGQQALLQKLQVKVQKSKTVQDTCKKQEKVIVKLEQLLAEKGKGQFNGASVEHSDTYRTLSEENVKLQAELMHFKDLLQSSEAKKKQPRSSHGKTANGPMSDLERLELYEKLERAEGRILALEKQLADNVRKWAKDKADLQIKLNERIVMQTTGYKDSSTSLDMMDWNGHKSATPSRSLGPRRPSPKLDPLTRR